MLTLDEARSLARENAFAMRTAEQAMQRVAVAEQRRRTIWRPVVDLTAAYTLHSDEPAFEIPDLLSPLAPYLAAAAALDPTLPAPGDVLPAPPEAAVVRHRHDTRLMVEVTQPLFVPSHAAVRDRVEAGRAQAQAGQAAAADGVEAAVESLYFAALAQQRVESVIVAGVAALEADVERARAVAEAGAGPAVDVDLAELAWLDATSELDDVRSARLVTLDALAELLRVAGPVDVAPFEPGGPDGVVSTDASLRARRPPLADVEAAAARGEEAAARQARASVLPALVAQAATTVQRDTAFAEPVTWQLRVAAVWSPYDGGARRADVREAELGAAEARLREEEALSGAAGELRRQQTRVDRARRAVEQARASAALARSAAEALRGAWEAGALGYVDVEQGASRARAADAAEQVALVQLAAAEVQLRRLAVR